LAAHPAFQETIATLSDTDRDQKADEELVVRYLALKNARNEFKGSVRDWLDSFLEQVLLNQRHLDRELEEADFDRVFSFLRDTFGPDAFVKYRDDRPIGALAPAFFEAVTMGTWENRDLLADADKNRVRENIVRTLQTPEFKAQTGPGANSKPKLDERIRLIAEAVRA
jgi:hypothetical protein